jgi:hypothetical protein
MPYLEWKHSSFEGKQTCQQYHMPEVKEPTPQGARRHVFVVANFLMASLLNDHRKDLGTETLPEELIAANARTKEFLQTQAAKVEIQSGCGAGQDGDRGSGAKPGRTAKRRSRSRHDRRWFCGGWVTWRRP